MRGYSQGGEDAEPAGDGGDDGAAAAGLATKAVELLSKDGSDMAWSLSV